MASMTFTISLEIGASADAIHRVLRDVHAMRVLHPLIEEVQDLPRDPNDPDANRYRVIDRIPWGPLRLRAAYIATLRAVSASEIRATTEQFPAIRLETTYRLSEIQGSTRVDEDVRVTAPRLLCRWVGGQAEVAHRTMLARLKVHLEGVS